MRNLLITILVCVCFSFGSAWQIQQWRYDAKLLSQEKSFTDSRRIIQEKHRETLAELNKNSKDKTDWFQKELERLEDENKKFSAINSNLSDTISRLRDTEIDLRTRIRTLPNETIRDYALSASTALTEITEALRGEQLAHQETSRKADEYHSAWKALDQAWPEAK